jgi:hypothetical protein
VLELLQDITVTFSESAPMGFTLHFHFKENDYFTNTILTKEYEMKCEPMVSRALSLKTSGPLLYFVMTRDSVRRIRIHRIHMFLSLPDPDPLLRCHGSGSF